MKHSNLKFPCLIAVFYFGMNVNAQEIPRDTVDHLHPRSFLTNLSH